MGASPKKKGSATLVFPTRPAVREWASVVGSREAQGPLGSFFDIKSADNRFGRETWEQSEAEMQRVALETALRRAGLEREELELVLAGDLLDQCVSSSFGLMEFNAPYCGLYGACSTIAEGLTLAAMAVDGGYAQTAAAVSASHYCTAERQYRQPLEYGAQRTPHAQWTVTGAGAAVVAAEGDIRIEAAAIGRIIDLGVTDANNMGAAMAPAAHDTLARLFADTGTSCADYDAVFTGDLGVYGAKLLRRLFADGGAPLGDNYSDCGVLIYGADGGDEGDTHAGGSGCGCLSSVLCGMILRRLRAGELKRVVIAGTGALLSPESMLQGQSIPGICHAAVLARD